MKERELQIVWAAAGFYKGNIDGDIGPKSMTARGLVENSGNYNHQRMSQKRRFIASAQWCLNKLGFESGAVDGYNGHNTANALNALLHKLATGENLTIEKQDQEKYVNVDWLPRQSEVNQFYGNPETEVPSRLVQIVLPFKFRIDYSLNQSTNKITVHRKVAKSLEAALIAVHDHYGMPEMRRLGIDRYAGAYNKRKMRGGTSWSMHAYGCAIDFYAAKNGLSTRCPRALFCGPEYKAFLDIMEAHGWLPAIRLWGADGMHFQAATL